MKKNYVFNFKLDEDDFKILNDLATRTRRSKGNVIRWSLYKVAELLNLEFENSEIFGKDKSI